MDDRTALTRALTDVVRQVPGVTAVYSSAPLLTATVSKVTQLVTRGGVGPDLVALSEADGELVVSVTIGVSDDVPATQVCRAVYDALAEQVALAEGAAASAGPAAAARATRIAVKVGRIG